MKIFTRISILFTIICLSVFFLCGCDSKSELTDDTDYDYEYSETSGGMQTVRVSFPEGFTVIQIAQRLEENNVCSADEFINAAKDKTYLDDFGFTVSTPERRVYVLEGYLFPDTYDFYIGESVESVIKKFLRNTDARITSEMRSRASELGYTVDEIISLASIIQGEAGGGRESANVSSVIHNRLNGNPPMKIECDASATYLKKYVKPYYDEDTYYSYCLDYNTYNCSGIPVGAINNPGLTAINAALYPSNTDYLFFLTDSDGVYHYAQTYDDHLINKRNAGL